MAPHSPPQGTNPDDSILINSSPSAPAPAAAPRPRARASFSPFALLPQPANMTATMQTAHIETSSSSSPRPVARHGSQLARVPRTSATNSPAFESDPESFEPQQHSSPEPGDRPARRQARVRATRNKAPDHDVFEPEEEIVHAQLDQSSSPEQLDMANAKHPHIRRQHMMSRMEVSDSEAEKSFESEPSPDPELPKPPTWELITDAFPRSPTHEAKSFSRHAVPLASAIPSKRNIVEIEQCAGDSISNPFTTNDQDNAANAEPHIKRLRRSRPASVFSHEEDPTDISNTITFPHAPTVPYLHCSDHSSANLSSEDDSRDITLPDAADDLPQDRAPSPTDVVCGGKNRMLAALAPFNRSSPPPGKTKTSVPISVGQPRTLRNRNRPTNTLVHSAPRTAVQQSSSPLSEESDSDGDADIPASAPNLNTEQTLRHTQVALGDLRQRYREACGDWERRNGSLRTEVQNGKTEAEYWRQKYKFELNDLVARKVKNGIEKATAEMSKEMDKMRIDMEREVMAAQPVQTKTKGVKGKGKGNEKTAEDICTEVNEAMDKLIKLDPSMASKIARFNPTVDGALTALSGAVKARNVGDASTSSSMSSPENGRNVMPLHSLQANPTTKIDFIGHFHAAAIAAINSLAEDLATAIEDLRSTTGPNGGLAPLKRSAARKIKAAVENAEQVLKEGFDDTIASLSSSSTNDMALSSGGSADPVRSSAASRMPSSNSGPNWQLSSTPSSDTVPSSSGDAAAAEALAKTKTTTAGNGALQRTVLDLGGKVRALNVKLAEEVRKRKELEEKLASSLTKAE